MSALIIHGLRQIIEKWRIHFGEVAAIAEEKGHPVAALAKRRIERIAIDPKTEAQIQMQVLFLRVDQS